jgi:DNA-directed RNA polymerase specialized sigma24 family protein
MVEFNQALPDANDLLVGSSVPSLSFKDAVVGDSYTGVITDLRTVQVRNYEDPTKLEFWDDGKPKLQIEVTLSTGYADPSDPEDDGSRRVFLFGQKLRAAQDEMRKKGIKKLELGAQFTITLSGTKPSTNKRYNDVKLYTIGIDAPTSNSAVDALLSVGATEVVADATIETLTPKQVKVAETLQSNGFTAEEIAENLGVSVPAVNAVLTF